MPDNRYLPDVSDEAPVETPTRSYRSSPVTTGDPALDVFKTIIPEMPKMENQNQSFDGEIASKAVPAKTKKHAGLNINRFFTPAGLHPFETVAWITRTSRITDEKGTVIFDITDVEVPETWSQLATDIVVSKYF